MQPSPELVILMSKIVQKKISNYNSRIVSDRKKMSICPSSPDQFLDLTRRRHTVLLKTYTWLTTTTTGFAKLSSSVNEIRK